MNIERKLVQLVGVPMSIQKIKLGNHILNFVEAGSGEPLILIHGVNIGWGQWYQNISQLSKHYRIYALDLPGSGKSSKINFQKTDLEKDLVETVEMFVKSKNMGRVNIIGHSVGGWVALKLSLRNKIKINKLVLVDPVGFIDYLPWAYRPIAFFPLAFFISRFLMKPTPKNITKFFNTVVVNQESVSDLLVQYYCESLQSSLFSHPLFLINRMSGFFKIRRDFVLRDKFSQVKNPILVIHGDKDPLIPSDKIAEIVNKFSNMQLKIITDSGHVPALEQSEQFNQEVLKFLKE